MSACDEYRERVWTALDGGSTPPDAHCAACRAYAEQAGRLHSMLPQLLGEIPQISVRAAVLARLRVEEPSRAWIPLSVFLSLGAAYALCVWMGWDALGEAGSMLPSLREMQRHLFMTTAEVPMKTAAAAAVAAAALSYLTLKRRDSHV